MMSEYLIESINQINQILFALDYSDVIKLEQNVLADLLPEVLEKNFQINDIGLLLSSHHALFKLDKLIQFKLSKEKGIADLELEEAFFLSENKLFSNVIYLETPIYFKMRNSLREVRVNELSLLQRGASASVPQHFYDLDKLLRADLPKVSDEFGKVAQEIEQIINGKFALNEEGNVMYHEDGRQEAISLQTTSSGIANLGMISLLLRRNILNKGSFLFIDEPELNLHTTWQHIMMEVLVKLSQAGVNVVIATHSLDMLQRLEHIANQMPKEEAEQLFSVNCLGDDGVTISGSLYEELYQAKEILGAPYVKLMLGDDDE